MAKGKEKIKKTLRISAFLLLFVILFLRLQSLFNIGNNRSFQSITGFYKERPNSLDAVYIGSSNVHCFWIPVNAWQNHGISVLSYAANSMPVMAIKYIINEALKTQPDALFILNINAFRRDSEPGQVQIHRLADYMPFSLNKLRMIDALADEMGAGPFERLEFYFPLLRFHARWDTLTGNDFYPPSEGIKNALNFMPHWKSVVNFSKSYTRNYYEEGELSENQQSELLDLLNYLNEKNIKVLFVTVPQSIPDKETVGQLNKIEAVLRQQGFPCLNLLNEPEITGVLPQKDFYDQNHTNLHGALKYTEYLSQYLIENYGFADKRGDPEWSDWDKANDRYTRMIKPYALPFERDGGLRDYDLLQPDVYVEKQGPEVTVTWEPSEGAEAYDVYRKGPVKTDADWKLMTRTGPDVLTFSDGGLEPGSEYAYTVVPLRTDAGNEIYGDYKYNGVTLKTD